MQVADDVNELAGRFEYTRDLLVRDADEAERVEESRADEVVAVHLGTCDLVPYRHRGAVGTFDGYRTVDARRLVQANVLDLSATFLYTAGRRKGT